MANDLSNVNNLHNLDDYLHNAKGPLLTDSQRIRHVDIEQNQTESATSINLRCDLS